jgi:hypothetical protein
MDCVSPKRRRRRSDSESEELPDEIREKVAGLLDEEALEHARTLRTHRQAPERGLDVQVRPLSVYDALSA